MTGSLLLQNTSIFLKSNLSKINNTEKENNENSGKQPYR